MKLFRKERPESVTIRLNIDAAKYLLNEAVGTLNDISVDIRKVERRMSKEEFEDKKTDDRSRLYLMASKHERVRTAVVTLANALFKCGAVTRLDGAHEAASVRFDKYLHDDFLR